MVRFLVYVSVCVYILCTCMCTCVRTRYVCIPSDCRYTPPLAPHCFACGGALVMSLVFSLSRRRRSQTPRSLRCYGSSSRKFASRPPLTCCDSSSRSSRRNASRRCSDAWVSSGVLRTWHSKESRGLFNRSPGTLSSTRASSDVSSSLVASLKAVLRVLLTRSCEGCRAARPRKR